MKAGSPCGPTASPLLFTFLFRVLALHPFPYAASLSNCPMHRSAAQQLLVPKKHCSTRDEVILVLGSLPSSPSCCRETSVSGPRDRNSQYTFRSLVLTSHRCGGKGREKASLQSRTFSLTKDSARRY